MDDGTLLMEKTEALCDRQDRFVAAMNAGNVFEMYGVFLEEELAHMEMFSDIVQDPELKAYAAMLIADCSMRCKMTLEAVREKINSMNEDQ